MRALGTPDEGTRHAAAATVRKAFEAMPLIPAIKAVVARRLSDPAYATVRPPLVPMSPEEPRVVAAAALCFGEGGG
jgi:4-hydroxy-tetrahydrodipicolinate synthase